MTVTKKPEAGVVGARYASSTGSPRAATARVEPGLEGAPASTRPGGTGAATARRSVDAAGLVASDFVAEAPSAEGARSAAPRGLELRPGTLAALEQRLGALGLSDEQLRALLLVLPELKQLGIAASQDLVAVASAARVAPAELEGFLTACARRYGDLRTAAAVLGPRMAGIPREVASNAEHRSAMEALRKSTSLEGLDGGRMMALHRAALDEARTRFGEALRAELGLAAAPAVVPSGVASDAPAEAADGPRGGERIEPARRRLVDATAAVVAADQGTALTLERVRAALTPEQVHAVLEAHLRRTADLRGERDAAAEALASTLARSSLPPEWLLDGYEALAMTPLAETALRWASSQASDPSSPLRGTEALERVAAAAAEGAAADVLARAASPEAGVDLIAQYLAPLATTNMKRFELASAAAIARKLARGKLGELGALVEGTLWNHPLARALQVTGLVAAVASTATEVQQGELTAALRTAALGGLIGHGLLQGAAASLANAGEAARLSGAAGTVATLARWSSKIFPSLVVAFYAGTVAKNLGTPERDVGTNLALAGNCVSMVGAALGLSGVGVAPAAILTVSGYALSGAGGLVSASLADERMAEADRALLATANGVLAERGARPLDDGLLRALTRPGVSLDAWAALALAPEALQALLARHPEVGLLGRAPARELLTSAAAIGVGAGVEELSAFIDAAKRRWGDLVSASLALGELRLRAPSPVGGRADREAWSDAVRRSLGLGPAAPRGDAAPALHGAAAAAPEAAPEDGPTPR